jgi:hypothetical protein
MNVDHKFAPEKSRPEDLLSPDAAPPLSNEDSRNWPTITDEMMLENRA